MVDREAAGQEYSRDQAELQQGLAVLSRAAETLVTEFVEVSMAERLAQKAAQLLMIQVRAIAQREQQHLGLEDWQPHRRRAQDCLIQLWQHLALHCVRQDRHRPLGQALQLQDHCQTTNDAPSTLHDRPNRLAQIAPLNQQGPPLDRAARAD